MLSSEIKIHKYISSVRKTFIALIVFKLKLYKNTLSEMEREY